jgi:hypothetical protein
MLYPGEIHNTQKASWLGIIEVPEKKKTTPGRNVS